MNTVILMLILVPVLFSVLYLLSNNKTYYKILSYILSATCIILSIMLAFHGTYSVTISGGTFKFIDLLTVFIEVFIIAFIFYASIRHKRGKVFALAVIQTVFFIYTTFFMKKPESFSIVIDKLSIIMSLIICSIGTLILIFSNGYITIYEKHKNIKSKQKLFYFVICNFLAAMNGLVFSDTLSFVYFFWEITTLASFVLISYNGDKEAYNSGFLALGLNIIGGISFSMGIILYQNMMNISTLSQIIKHGQVSGILILPVFLLCIAGFTKSAQMPFHSWLLGAMVAPTPVSALLHSSTMVKAGVYLIIKLVPAYAGTTLGTAIALYGGFTFLICSAIAVSQRNAKRVLAYSTIANLGLIICSAGMGSSTAVAAAIILIIFHAASKALLFLCTGQIEHTIGSRDIEDMTGLIHIAPGLAIITVIGLISMILPPFGVLITKLISIEASANNPFIVIFIVLGSALTTLYYVKWIGSIVSYPESKVNFKKHSDFNIFFPLSVLICLIFGTSIFISPIYNNLVKPEITELLPFAKNGLSVSRINIKSQIGMFNNEIVFVILGFVILIALIVWKFIVKNTDMKNIYMCGENNSEDETLFRSSNGQMTKASVGNLYFSQIFHESTLTELGTIVSIAIILIVLFGGLTK